LQLLKLWIALINNHKDIIGIGTTKGTKEIRTATTNSSANMFPKSQKLSDKGFVNLLKY
jgi:hypothetical protein